MSTGAEEAVKPEDLEVGNSITESLEKSRMILTGHPADGGTLGLESQEDDAQPPTRTDPPEPSDPPEPPDPPKPKHATWDETEKARINAEARMTTAAQEAAEAKREADTLRQELEEAKKPAVVDPAEAAKPVTLDAKARVKQALKAVRELDEEDPEYDDKVAEAWAQAGIGAPGVTLDAKEIAKEAARLTREEIKAETTAQREKEETAAIRKDAASIAAKAGLDMEDGSADHIIFWKKAGQMPEDIKAKPFEAQVDWAVNEVRRLTGKVVETVEQARERARRAQANNTVLERGPARPKGKQTSEEPYTLGSLIDKSIAVRRI